MRRILPLSDRRNVGDGGMHLYFHCCSKVLFVLEVVGGGGRGVTQFQPSPSAPMRCSRLGEGARRCLLLGESFPLMFGTVVL